MALNDTGITFEGFAKALTGIVIVIGIAIIVIIAIFLFSELADSSSEQQVNVNEKFITNNSYTLVNTPINLIAKVKNDTWLNLNISTDFNVSIPQGITSVSLWFKNDTETWTNVISANETVYVNGSLDGSWEFFPYNLVNTTFISFGNSLNISIDQIQIYDHELNSSEVSVIFSNGRQ